VTERRYDEEEVAIILQRAAETRVGTAEGLTLAQLKEVAAEVGIDPAAIEAAAGSLDRQVASTPSPFLGTPAAPQYEQTVDVPFDRIDQGELVLAIRRAMERHGVLETRADGLEWRARDAGGGRYVSVLSRGESTLVRVLGNFRDGAIAWLAVGGTMTGAATLVLLKSLGVLVPGPAKGLGFLAAVLTGFVGGRLLWAWRYRRERRRLAATLEAVVEAARSSEDPGRGALPGGSEPPPTS
jgi:hypothetical protein